MERGTSSRTPVLRWLLGEQEEKRHRGTLTAHPNHGVGPAWPIIARDRRLMNGMISSKKPLYPAYLALKKSTVKGGIVKSCDLGI